MTQNYLCPALGYHEPFPWSVADRCLCLIYSNRKLQTIKCDMATIYPSRFLLFSLLSITRFLDFDSSYHGSYDTRYFQFYLHLSCDRNLRTQNFVHNIIDVSCFYDFSMRVKVASYHIVFKIVTGKSSVYLLVYLL